jgi:carboxymethylenebutenolidase
MGWGILTGESVSFRSGEATVRGHLGRPAMPGRFPAVILVHGLNGLEAGNRRAAERFGDEGYVGLAIDWQSRVATPSTEEVLQYVADAAAWLRTQEYVDGDRIAVGGYCYGGRVAYLALARWQWPWAGLIYHGTLTRERAPEETQAALDGAARIQAPLLMLHCAGDPRAPLEHAIEMALALQRHGKPFALKIYSGASHAFTLPEGSGYLPAAAADAWRETILFLDDLRRR